MLTALAAQCLKATFFPIGQHVSWHPDILRQVVAKDHTIGSHSWSHVNLAKKSLAEAKDEIENGISAVAITAGRPLAPFFRFPGLSQTPELTAYLAERNIGIFSIDINSFDFKLKNPDKVITSVMTKLEKRGKGIVLMHDFQHSTAVALPALLLQLKAKGFKVVHLKAKDPGRIAAPIRSRHGEDANRPDRRRPADLKRGAHGPVAATAVVGPSGNARARFALRVRRRAHLLRLFARFFFPRLTPAIFSSTAQTAAVSCSACPDFIACR